MKIGHWYNKIGRDVWAPAASRIVGRPVATTEAGRGAQTIQTLRTCGRSLFFSSALAYIPINVVLLTCWTTGRQQPWRSVTSGSCSPSVHLSPSSLAQTQTPTCNNTDKLTYKSGACLNQFYCNAKYTMTSASAGFGVTVSPREGWLRHSATYSEADSLPPPPNPEPPGPHTTSLNILNCHLVPGTLPYNSPPKKSSKKSSLLKFLLPQTIN